MRDLTKDIDNLIYDNRIDLELRIYRTASLLRDQDMIPHQLWYLIQLQTDRFLSNHSVSVKEEPVSSFKQVLLFLAGVFVGIFLMFFVIISFV